METNKLLTLEEIEEIDSRYSDVFFFEPNASHTAISKEELFALLATARAYHELKNTTHKETPNERAKRILGAAKKDRVFYDEYINPLEGKFVDIDKQDNNKPEDKPHAPTIKAMIEALKQGLIQVEGGVVTKVDFSPVIKSLESILKEL